MTTRADAVIRYKTFLAYFRANYADTNIDEDFISSVATMSDYYTANYETGDAPALFESKYEYMMQYMYSLKLDLINKAEADRHYNRGR